MKTFIVLLLLTLTCCSKSGKDAVTAPQIDDATGTLYTLPQNSQQYLGRYEGSLSSQANASVELSEGFNYILNITADGNSSERRGKFKWSGDDRTILLDSGEKFIVQRDSLIVSGSGSSQKYSLRKVSEERAAKSDAQNLSSEIAGIHWTMTELNGKAVRKPGKKDFHLQLLADGTFGAFAGCNSIGGRYKIKGSSVTFIEVMSTEMACAEMESESVFIETLQKTDNFIRNDKALMLRSGNSISAKFEAMPEKLKP